jgi:KamA family protein
MAKEEELQWLIERISGISHVKRLRIHSRLPVVIPARITQTLTHMLRETRLQVVLITHINHAQEVNQELTDAMTRLKQANVTLLNQGVMLKGVNNSIESQMNLTHAQFDAGILPYYIHVLDKVQGAAHFYISDQEAKTIMRGVMERVSGYLVPKLTREIGGRSSKTPLDLHLE